MARRQVAYGLDAQVNGETQLSVDWGVPRASIPLVLSVGPNGPRCSLPRAHATSRDRILVGGGACDLSVLCLCCFRTDIATTFIRAGLNAPEHRKDSHT